MDDLPSMNFRFWRAAPGICVRDIDVAYSFYSSVLGFATIFENGNPTGLMVLKRDQAEIHLSLKRDHQATTANVAHIFVNDAAALYLRCQSAGVRIVKRLVDKDYASGPSSLPTPMAIASISANGRLSERGRINS